MTPGHPKSSALALLCATILCAAAVAAAEDGRVARKSGDFGPDCCGYSAIGAASMIPASPNNVYAHHASGGLYCLSGSANTYVGEVVLPHGVDLRFFRAWARDELSDSGQTVSLESVCLPDLDQGHPVVTEIASVSSGVAAAPGPWSSSQAIPAVVLADNQSCTYRVTVVLSSVACSAGFAMGFFKARVEWERVAPPPPAAATFSDVPPTHGFHAVIEALADTGITQGCTVSEFCPDLPVTRAQMAAFLARALGLQPRNLADPANP